MDRLEPMTPGELLEEEFLKPMRISHGQLAEETDLSADSIAGVVAGTHPITLDLDRRLCRYFGVSTGYWLRAQAAYDSEVAAALRYDSSALGNDDDHCES